MTTKPPVDVEVTFVHQTEMAVLVEDADDKKIWVPKSQCEIDPEYPDRGDAITLTAPEHVLVEKELV